MCVCERVRVCGECLRSISSNFLSYLSEYLVVIGKELLSLQLLLCFHHTVFITILIISYCVPVWGSPCMCVVSVWGIYLFSFSRLPIGVSWATRIAIPSILSITSFRPAFKLLKIDPNTPEVEGEGDWLDLFSIWKEISYKILKGNIINDIKIYVMLNVILKWNIKVNVRVWW